MYHLYWKFRPLPEPIEEAIQNFDLNVAAVLSGNRNFEGRVHPLVKRTGWHLPSGDRLRLAGNIRTDLSSEPIGEGKMAKNLFEGYLADPS